MGKPKKTKALERLNRALSKIPGLKDLAADSPEFEKWHRNTEVAIGNTFGDKSRHVRDFTAVGYYLAAFSSGTPKSAYREAYVRGLESAASVLQSMIEEIEEYWDDDQPVESSGTGSTRTEVVASTKVFIIHGRDDGCKETVARFVEKLGLDPVILHEQANKGMTLIEKFEHHAEVGFAIALLTPDDVGGLADDSENLKPRARQNVVLELGYFMGILGRQRVCALTRGDVEIPV